MIITRKPFFGVYDQYILSHTGLLSKARNIDKIQLHFLFWQMTSMVLTCRLLYWMYTVIANYFAVTQALLLAINCSVPNNIDSNLLTDTESLIQPSILSRIVRKPALGFPTRSEKCQAVLPL